MEHYSPFSRTKLPTKHTWQWCTYAAAITAGLAKGQSPLAAVKAAKSFITKAIAHGLDVGQGYGPTNPMAVLLTADCADSSQH